MSEKIEFNLEVDLRPSGKQEIFKSIDSVQKWLGKEIEFWKWPDDFPQKDNEAFQCVHLQVSRLTDIENHINRVKDNSNNLAVFNSQKEQLRGVLEQYYKNGQVLHSSHPRAKFLQGQIVSNPLHAAFILRYYIEKDNTYGNNRKYFEGALHALLFDYNIKDIKKGELKSLEELRNAWQEHLNHSKNESDKTFFQFEELLKVSDAQKENQNNKFEELLKKSEEEHEKHIENVKKRFKEIEELYEKKLALHASMKYWGDKGKSHFNWAIGFTGTVLLGFGGVGLWFYHIMTVVIGDSKINDIEVWKLGQLLIVATIGVWLMRVLIRLLLSNIHLWSDANERKTMLQTYLALNNEGKLPEESRELILQVLFRPTSTGIIRDDAAPPFMAEWIKRVTGSE